MVIHPIETRADLIIKDLAARIDKQDRIISTLRGREKYLIGVITKIGRITQAESLKHSDIIQTCTQLICDVDRYREALEAIDQDYGTVGIVGGCRIARVALRKI